MVELGGGSVHELSYQQARNNRTTTGQVYVAEPGRCGRRGAQAAGSCRGPGLASVFPGSLVTHGVLHGKHAPRSHAQHPGPRH